MLDGVETQRPGQRVEDVDRHIDRASLFQPRVPTHGHTGEKGDLLASQSWCPAPMTGREAHVRRRDRPATGPQERGQIGPRTHGPIVQREAPTMGGSVGPPFDAPFPPTTRRSSLTP